MITNLVERYLLVLGELEMCPDEKSYDAIMEELDLYWKKMTPEQRQEVDERLTL